MDHVKGALGPLFIKVVELLRLVECKIQMDHNKEVETLECLKCDLRKLQSLEIEGQYVDEDPQHEVRVWADVRELSYDVEDVVDNFLLCLECSEPIPDNDIDTLKRLVQKMTDMHPANLMIQSDVKIPTEEMIHDDAARRHASSTSISPSVQAMYTDTTHLVGMRRNMNRLRKLIFGSKVAMDTSEMSDQDWDSTCEETSDDISDNTSDDTSEDEDMPAKKKTKIDYEKGNVLLGTEELNKFKEHSSCKEFVNLEMSHMPEEYSGTNDKLFTEVPADSLYKPKIACVVGNGGLGKTTLVRALYERVKEDFSCKAFVSVGQNANEKKVLRDILLALDKGKYTSRSLAVFNEKQLIDVLRRFLRNQSYLIVIDDIWEKKIWRTIEYAFRNESNFGSQILTTTRCLNVAEACCASDDRLIYHMRPLSDKKSKVLFNRRVFSQEGGECPDDFKQVSTAILKKCGGVPLAIITIASLLAGNGDGIKPMNEWNHVLNAIGCGLSERQSVGEMNRILSLSYNDLSPELKNCLLYIAVFPEDSKIKKSRLVSRWIAEGFIQRTNQDDSLFEIGENYFSMLINRCIIEPVSFDREGKVHVFRVHDMVLSLLCLLSSEANFVTVIDGSTRTAPNSGTKIRRLSIQDSTATAAITAELYNPCIDMAHVRSFTLSSSTYYDAASQRFLNRTKDKHYEHVNEARSHVTKLASLSTFQVLRVLDLQDCPLEKDFHKLDPWCVRSLLHLRYLGLSNTEILVLPVDVGKLKFLQILDLRGTSIGELPSSIVELQQLICLRVDVRTRLPDDFGKLTSLEELTHLEVDRDSAAYIAKQLGYLTKLRVLWITPRYLDERCAEILVESLNKLLEIRTLDLRDYGTYEKVLYGTGHFVRRMEDSWKPSKHLHKFWGDYYCRFSVVPNWIHELSNITCLTIYLKKLTMEDMDNLGKLLCLQYLCIRNKIRDDKDPVNIMDQMEQLEFENDIFPAVTVYSVLGFVTFPLMFPKGAMPKVEMLEFHVRDEDFSNMNLEMGHFLALQEVKVVISYKPDDVQKKGGYYASSSAGNVSGAEAALRNRAASHPNRPTIDIETRIGYELKSDYWSEDDEDFWTFREDFWGTCAEYKDHDYDNSMRTHDDDEYDDSIWTNDDNEDEDGQKDKVKAQVRSSDMEADNVQANCPSLPLREIAESSAAMSTHEAQEATKQWSSSRDARVFDVQTSLLPDRLTKIDQESGYPSLAPLGIDVLEDKCSLAMSTHEAQEAAKQQSSYRDTRVGDVQTSLPPHRFTEIDKASGFPSLAPLGNDVVEDKSSSAMSTHEAQEAAMQWSSPRYTRVFDVQTSLLPDRLTEIDHASGYPSLVLLGTDVVEDKWSLAMSMNEAQKAATQQSSYRDTRVGDVQTSLPPDRLTAIDKASGFLSLEPLGNDEVKDKSSAAMSTHEAQEAAMQWSSPRDTWVFDVQTSLLPDRLTEIYQASGLLSMAPLGTDVVEDKWPFAMSTHEAQEAAKQQSSSRDARVGDVQTSLPPDGLTEIDQASGFPSLAPLGNDMVEDKSSAAMSTHEAQEAAKQQPSSSDARIGYVQTSLPPNRLIKIDQASVFPSLAPLGTDVVEDKSSSAMSTHEAQEAVNQQPSSRDARVGDVQTELRVVRVREIDQASGFSSLPPLNTNVVENTSSLSISTHESQEPAKMQPSSSDARVGYVQSNHPPNSPIKIYQASEFPSLAPLGTDVVEDKSSSAMSTQEAQEGKFKQPSSKDAQVDDVQTGLRLVRVREIDQASGFSSVLPLSTHVVENKSLLATSTHEYKEPVKMQSSPVDEHIGDVHTSRLTEIDQRSAFPSPEPLGTDVVEDESSLVTSTHEALEAASDALKDKSSLAMSTHVTQGGPSDVLEDKSLLAMSTHEAQEAEKQQLRSWDAQTVDVKTSLLPTEIGEPSGWTEVASAPAYQYKNQIDEDLDRIGLEIFVPVYRRENTPPTDTRECFVRRKRKQRSRW